MAHGLNGFTDQNGPIFLKVYQNGGTNYPIYVTSPDPTEVPQDIEWIHALALKANIVVVELSSRTIPNPNIIQNWLFLSIPAPSVVSSSFGGATLNGPDSIYVANVSYLASSGIFGSSGYANSSVVSVDYTQLKTTSQGDYSSEASVKGGTMQTTGKSFQSGGGSDSSQVQPAYQSAIPCGSGAANPVSPTYRTLPDVAFNGAEPSGLSVYNSLINTTATNFKTATSAQAAGANAAFGGAPWGNPGAPASPPPPGRPCWPSPIKGAPWRESRPWMVPLNCSLFFTAWPAPMPSTQSATRSTRQRNCCPISNRRTAQRLTTIWRVLAAQLPTKWLPG
jgi:hypothetical protein